MKKFSIIPVFIVLLLATQALAGTLTVNGSLAITTNLTAQSITLGGVTEINSFARRSWD
jgi:DIM protein